jgi:hypothetical protein
MRTVTAAELRSVNAGGSEYCSYCHRTFKDKTYKIFRWTITVKSGEQEWAQHLRGLGTTCMYAK